MASFKSSLHRGLRVSGCALWLALSTLDAAHAAAGPDASPDAWPSAALSDRAAVEVDASQLLPTPQLVRWQVDLDRRGLRSTGSPAHERYIDVLRRRLARAGVQQLHTEATTLARWAVRHWRLDVADGAPREPIDVAGYLPYSGDTGRDGIVAPIRYLAAGQTPDADVAGKIAVVEWPALPLTGAFFRERALRVFDPDNAFAPSAPYVRTSFMLGTLTAMLDRLQAAGAAGAAGVVMIAAPAFVMPPLNPNGDGSANDALWPGEGQYFWGRARVPTINLITGPTYLLNYGVSTAEKIDYARLRREIAATTQMLLDLSRVPFDALRAVPPRMRAAAP